MQLLLSGKRKHANSSGNSFPWQYILGRIVCDERAPNIFVCRRRLPLLEGPGSPGGAAGGKPGGCPGPVCSGRKKLGAQEMLFSKREGAGEMAPGDHKGSRGLCAVVPPKHREVPHTGVGPAPHMSTTAPGWST